jgi:cytochrome c-type biogenesis protein CcmH
MIATIRFLKPVVPVLRPLLLASALIAALSVQAFTLEEFEFDSPEQQQEFRALIGELRCLVCQNESLAGSQAGLAQDLRNEVYRMMQAGRSRDEIVEFLVARYGDFVLYDPPLKPSTYFLWFGPFVLIGIGAIFMVRALMRKRSAPDRTLSEEERQRLQTMLAGQSGDADRPE